MKAAFYNDAEDLDQSWQHFLTQVRPPPRPIMTGVAYRTMIVRARRQGHANPCSGPRIPIPTPPPVCRCTPEGGEQKETRSDTMNLRRGRSQ